MRTQQPMHELDNDNADPVPQLEAESTGWDAHAVWRERLRAARTGEPLPKARMVAPGPTAGWDPMQTARLQARRAGRSL